MDTSRASKAFEAFTGRKPSKKRAVKLDSRNVAGWEMGPMVGVAYEATRDGKTDRYFHEFKPKARPSLVARDDGKQLYIEGGRYKVTERGIEDMPLLMVVNPSSRKGKRPMARRRRKTAVRRRAPVVVVTRNPARRRRRRASHIGLTSHRRRYRRNPVARRRAYRRNPSARAGLGKLSGLIIPAVGIGLGAVGAEIITGYLPIPAGLKSGPAKHLIKGAVGIAAGMVVGKMLRQPRLGKYIALGAVVIAAHDTIKELIVSNMPGVKFGGLGYANPGMLTNMNGMGEFVPNNFRGVGEFVPAFGGVYPTNGGGGENEFNV